MSSIQGQGDGRPFGRLTRPPRPWRRGVVLRVLAVLFAACLVTAPWLLLGGDASARAGAGVEVQTKGQKVAAFEDVFIGRGEVWENVVVVGGDVVIQGTVTDVVVVVGGDLAVLPGAAIGAGLGGDSHDAAIVSVFGDVTVQSGATVSGRTVDVAGGLSDTLNDVVVDPILRPWQVGSVWDWEWAALFVIVVAVIAVLVAPRQVAFVRERVEHHFFSSLGWGALGALIGIPVVSVLLIASIFGILLLVPWLAIVVPVFFLFGLVAVGAAVGRLILGKREDRRGPLLLAAVLGVVIFCLVRWAPVAGAVILLVVLLVGFGATWAAIWDWRRQTRRKARGKAAQVQAAPAEPQAPQSTAPEPEGAAPEPSSAPESPPAATAGPSAGAPPGGVPDDEGPPPS